MSAPQRVGARTELAAVASERGAQLEEEARRRPLRRVASRSPTWRELECGPGSSPSPAPPPEPWNGWNSATRNQTAPRRARSPPARRSARATSARRPRGPRAVARPARRADRGATAAMQRADPAGTGCGFGLGSHSRSRRSSRASDRRSPGRVAFGTGSSAWSARTRGERLEAPATQRGAAREPAAARAPARGGSAPRAAVRRLGRGAGGERPTAARRPPALALQARRLALLGGAAAHPAGSGWAASQPSSRCAAARESSLGAARRYARRAWS